MPCPVVHLLESAAFNSDELADAISASVEESGNAAEYVATGTPNLGLVAVDRIAATVTITLLAFPSDVEVGDAATSDPGLRLSLKARAAGKGTTGTAVNIDFAKAVCVGRGGGPVIEGDPTYTLTFRCHAACPA